MVIREYDITHAISAFIKHTENRYVSPGDLDWEVYKKINDSAVLVKYSDNTNTYLVESIQTDEIFLRVSIL